LEVEKRELEGRKRQQKLEELEKKRQQKELEDKRLKEEEMARIASEIAVIFQYCLFSFVFAKS
jgi:hypothetical protein